MTYKMHNNEVDVDCQQINPVFVYLKYEGYVVTKLSKNEHEMKAVKSIICHTREHIYLFTLFIYNTSCFRKAVDKYKPMLSASVFSNIRSIKMTFCTISGVVDELAF